MTTVIVDDVLRAKLNGLQEQLELRDESGRTVGRFLPEGAYMKLLYAWLKTEFSNEEVAEAREEYRTKGGATTAEILARLHGLRRPG